MRRIIVCAIQHALLRVGGLGRYRSAQIAAERVQRFGYAPQKVVVRLTVEGVEVLEIQVQTVVFFLPQHGQHVLDKALSHVGVR